MTVSSIHALTHGWWGLLTAYTFVTVPMTAGLVRGRASWRKLIGSPLAAVPITIGAGVGISLINPVLNWFGVGTETLLHTGIAAAFTAAAGYVSGRILARTKPPPEIVHQRGAIVEAAPVKGERSHATRGREKGLSLAGVAIPLEQEVKHFKIIGTTGSGKSTAINELISGALKRGDRAIIADPDGGYLNRYYDADRGDVILNPFHQRSVRWDLFGEIKQAFDIEHIAHALIPDEGTHDDRSWRSYGRTFVTSILRGAHKAGLRDVKELYRLLVITSADELRPLLRETPAQPFLEEHNGRMFDSIRSATSANVRALEYVAEQEAESFSMRDWVRRGTSGEARAGVLFVPYTGNQIMALRPMISAWMRLGIFEAMNQKEGDHRLWFVIDELDALGPIDGLKDALTRVRKFGGRCMLGFQSIAQVSSTYGMGHAQSIVENCGNTLILRCSSSEQGGTSRFASYAAASIRGVMPISGICRVHCLPSGNFSIPANCARHRTEQRRVICLLRNVVGNPSCTGTVL